MVQEGIQDVVFSVTVKPLENLAKEGATKVAKLPFILFMLAMKKAHEGIVHPQGKQPMKKLVRQGQGTSSVEVDGENMKEVERILHKFGVDYAVHYHKDDNRYEVFFKGKDADVVAAALKAGIESQLKKKTREPSLLHKLKNIAQELAKNAKNKRKEKNHEKDEPER